MKASLIVFSDLDGTLLDAATYRYEPARPAIDALAEAGIPLIFCTSKTRPETECWRRVLANVHPFIVENGGAVVVPEGTFGPGARFDLHDGGYGLLEFGRPYHELRRALAEIREATGLPLRGFGDMPTGEIAERCGFAHEDAALAAARAYDEPFIGAGADGLPRVMREAERRGLRVIGGGRFQHLVGGSDKGRAVRALRSLYERGRGRVRAVALGDSDNDLPMLREADIPVLVPRPGGGPGPALDVPGLILAPGPGPEGWRDVILALLRGPA